MNSVRRRLEAADDDRRSTLLDELAAAAATGDTDAAADLAWSVRHFRLARPALHRVLIKEHDIEVAEQRTLVAVALRIGSFEGRSRFTTWLHRVAVNEAKQFVRSETRRRDRIPAAAPIDDEVAHGLVARVSSMIADRARIAAEIAQLPDSHRRALLLREDQGLSYAEIGRELDVPDSTAKTWVRRARLRLAERLSQP